MISMSNTDSATDYSVTLYSTCTRILFLTDLLVRRLNKTAYGDMEKSHELHSSLQRRLWQRSCVVAESGDQLTPDVRGGQSTRYL